MTRDATRGQGCLAVSDQSGARPVYPAPRDVDPPRSPARPLRVLLVADSLAVGGAERHVCDLALALAARGHAVTVGCSVRGSLAPLLDGRVPVRTLRPHPVKRRFSLSYAWGLRRLIRRERIDLVHAHMYASVTASALATRGTNVPLVVSEHSEASWRGRGARRLNRYAYGRAARIIAVSRAIHRRLVAVDGVAPERITVILNAVPPPPAPSSPPAPSPQFPPLESASLPEVTGDGPLVGVVARLQYEKGVTYVVEAAALVVQQEQNTTFLVVGDGPLREELSSLVRRLGLDGRVLFLGARRDARAIIGRLDALVVPSLSEGTPLVILEAMAAGVPVVASAVGGIPEQIEHGTEGILVPAGDVSALGQAIVDLLRDPARAREMGEAARRRAALQFTHAAMVRAVEHVYRDALSAQAPHPAPRGTGVRP